MAAHEVFVAIGFALAHGLSGVLDMPDGDLHLEQGLMTWDGTFYRVITTGWYSGAEVPAEAVRFFPGYPALGRVFELRSSATPTWRCCSWRTPPPSWLRCCSGSSRWRAPATRGRRPLRGCWVSFRPRT
ncbi:MAG: hypothetical protein R2716_02625 [Microthrixaceae bacterium]